MFLFATAIMITISILSCSHVSVSCKSWQAQALLELIPNNIIISYVMTTFCTNSFSIKILWHCECAIFFNLLVYSHRVTSAGVSKAQTVICCDSPSLWCRPAMWPSSRILTRILGFTLCSYLYPQPLKSQFSIYSHL